jgi:membrane-associated protease RseP (regulator of RpoE activity)
MRQNRQLPPRSPAHRRAAVCLGLLALAGLSACTSDRVSALSPSSETLGERSLEDGTQLSYRLQDAGAGTPKLEVLTRRKRELPYLGMSVRELPREQAEAIGQEPWSGLQVERVTAGGAADQAGIWPGDVVVALGERPLVSVEQFTECVKLDLKPGEPVNLEVRRGEGPSRLIAVVPQSRSVEDTSTDTKELRGSTAVRALTGMSVGSLDADLAADLLAAPGPVLLIARVLPGSPAYLAGLRAGDRIEALDGRSPVLLEDLVGAVLARADERGFDVIASDRPAQLPKRTRGPLEISVNGPLGFHQTKVDLRTDLDRRRHIEIPILYERTERVVSRSWSFLDFILQFGGNGSVTYYDSKDRRPARHSFLSLLPFGFYEQNVRPERVNRRLFWFIEWGSDT